MSSAALLRVKKNSLIVSGMGEKIERKFLVNLARLPPFKSEHCRQGYLSTDPGRTVVVRVRSYEGLIIVKGKRDNMTRPEYFYEIPQPEAAQMLDLCQQHIIEKMRGYIDHGGHRWTVDCFMGQNQGLWLAEIELKDGRDSFAMPPWAGAEVTHDDRFYNRALSQNPYQGWRQKAPSFKPQMP